MAQAQRTCFVISPIGPEGSPIREEANDFLELLVEPALEKYGFNVTRADRISHPTAITTDIVRLVQESDLCLIDLTNTNPNVFYECGRRHETGRPFIQMIKKGNEGSLPFDVAGIRTVTYDVSSPRATRESILRLQEFIDTLVSAGFESTTSGDSLSSIAQGIERIERKLNQLASSSGQGKAIGLRPTDEEEDVLHDMLKSPREQFMSYLRKGRLDDACAMLDRLKKALPIDEYTTAMVLPASLGHTKTFERMDIELRDLIARPQQNQEHDERLNLMAEGAKKYFENTGEIEQGLKYLSDLYDAVSSSPHFASSSKAFVANKVGMLAWNADDHDTCIKYTVLAVGLNPSEPAFLFNLALAYKAVGREDELQETLKRLSRMKGLDADHVGLLRRYGYQYEG